MSEPLAVRAETWGSRANTRSQASMAAPRPAGAAQRRTAPNGNWVISVPLVPSHPPPGVG